METSRPRAPSGRTPATLFARFDTPGPTASIFTIMSDVDPASIDELRSRFRGEIVDSSDPGYDEARAVWNATVDKRPGVIARCADTEDVVASVAFARRSGLEIAVRGGGHSVSGHSSTDGGIVIDLRRMRSVTVDPDARTATVGGGSLIRDLDAETQRFGLGTTGGMVSHTGVGGLTLGGGYGYLARRFGLACDNLLSAEVVLADGSVVRTSASNEPELFWGLRGGGGNFGIVTSFEFRLHPLEPTVFSAELTYAAEHGPAVLRAFRDLVFARDDIVSDTYTGAVSRSWPGVDESLVGRPIVTAGFVVTGPNLEEGEAIAAQLRSVAPPLDENVQRQPYLTLQSSGDEISAPGVSRRYWKSSAFSELPDALLDAFLERGIASASVSPDLGLEMLASFGGAVARVGEDETAFGHRDAQVDFLALARWTDPSEDEDHIAPCRANWEAIAPFADAGVYVNNLGSEDRAREAYGEEKYRRLVALKDRVDPENVFHLNANILPSLTT